MNVLVTSLSRKVPLLAALQQALRELAPGGFVWGADADPECVGAYFADRFWQMPPLSEPDGPKELLDFCAREEIGLLVPTRDGELQELAQQREQLATAGTYVPVGTPEAVDTCLDKLRFHDHCRNAAIPTVATTNSLDELDGDLFVVKERRGAGAKEAALGLDRQRAAEYAQSLSEPIFQPLLSGAEHSVDLYVNRAGEVVEVAPRTRIRVHEGESNVTETVEHPELVDASVALAASLDLRGHVVIQGFARGSDVRVLECNPRVGGASTLGFHAGVDSPRWAIEEARGQTVEPRRGRYRRGLRLVRYPADRLIDR